MEHYYLFKCAIYEKKRDRMRKEVGIEGMRLNKLFADPKLIREN